VNLGEALLHRIDQYGGGEPASPVDSDRGRIARMNHLEKAHGGPRGAAAAVGVSRETWRRWRLTGKDPRTGRPRQKPSSTSLGKLRGAARKLYDAARDRRVRGALAHVRNVRITGIIEWDGYRNPIEQRSTTLGDMSLAGLHGPWKARDADSLAETFQAIIGREMDADIQILGDECRVEWT
jgi:hypothetical protein